MKDKEKPKDQLIVELDSLEATHLPPACQRGRNGQEQAGPVEWLILWNLYNVKKHFYSTGLMCIQGVLFNGAGKRAEKG
ncbi:MAG: hypothetical protein ACE5WD_09055 [Candidatus Aminicenantia bacterium]